MTFQPRISLSSTLLVSLLVSLLFSGFIKNFLSLPSLSLGAVLVDLFIALQVVHTVLVLVFHYQAQNKLDRTYLLLALFWCILLLFTLAKLSLVDANPIREKVLGLRNNLIYCFPMFYLPLLLQKENQVRKSLSLLLAIGLFLCLFGIFQFTFASRLPLSLLVLDGESAFKFYDQAITRPTALLGNTIIFASFTLLLFCLLFTKYLAQPKKTYLFYLALVLITNVLTYTRASLAGFLLCSIAILLLHYGRFTVEYLLKLVVGLMVTLTLLLSIGYHYRDSFIIKRLTGREASTQYSNEGHFSMIENALLYLQDHPLAGSGVGSQGPGATAENVIIPDGYWFQLLLENGILLGLLYLAFYLLCFVYVLLVFQKTQSVFLKQLCLTFIGISVYYYAASFINSAFIGRVNFILYWVMFGLVMAQHLIIKKQQNALPRH
ncbi:O-antigen ligase family protein [Rufibacter sediminis]